MPHRRGLGQPVIDYVTSQVNMCEHREGGLGVVIFLLVLLETKVKSCADVATWGLFLLVPHGCVLGSMVSAHSGRP